MANVIGDSGAGKTLLALTSFAEVSYDDSKEDVEPLYDDAEHAYTFNTAEVFGPRTADRIKFVEPPSVNIENFSDNLAAARKRGGRFLYILDSFDAIGAEDDTKHIEQERKIRLGESNKKSTGSYGMAKPKLASQLLREECGHLETTEGGLIIISQTRDNLTPGSFEKKTRSGGKALKFYATHEVWVILVGQIKDAKTGLRVGAHAEIKVTKSKTTGKRRNIEIDILDDYGIDDIGSMIDFLVSEVEAWGGNGARIDTGGDLGIPAVTKAGGKNEGGISRANLIKMVEEDRNVYEQLKAIVAEEWKIREESVKPERARKYE